MQLDPDSLDRLEKLVTHWRSDAHALRVVATTDGSSIAIAVAIEECAAALEEELVGIRSGADDV